ncbi:MAG: DUF1501 domain-containing protein [Planctomycetota bacterium]
MKNSLCCRNHPVSTRRDFLGRCGMGMGALGLAALMRDAGLSAADAPESPLAARKPHFAPKATRVIHIFCEGGPSQVDTFDPKPTLEKFHARLVDDVMKNYQKTAGEAASGMGRLSGKLQRSAFKFSKHGQSGLEISELFPKLSAHADELCVVRSMHTTTSVHEPAQLVMNTGEFASVRPSMGAWTVYGLGSENRNLPGFVSLSPSGTTSSGDKQWGNAFLPSWCGGTGIPTRDPAVTKMIENIRSGTTSLREQRRQLDLMHAMHEDFAQKHPGDALLEGRVSAFETAFRMQIEATDAFDLTREPAHIRALYGDTEQGRQLLLARRLVERGVRFVQVYHNGWDTHDLNDERHRELTTACDQPLHALLTDLKQRDMLKDTLILWGGEFGRTPTSDNNDVAKKKGIGRDHNAGGFTVWMAGGGVKAGSVYGGTDEFGALAAENPVDVHDLHATILHLLGFDHERLTYRYAGRDYRLTDVAGRVVKGVLA